ncbi:MAG: TolC family protein [Caulobacteraceae bacterium]
MPRPEAIAAAVLCAMALTGCATSALKMAPDGPDQPWSPATTSTGEIIPGEKGSASNRLGYVLPSNSDLAEAPAPPTIDSGKTYSLVELIDLAELNNPSTRIAWNDARKTALAAGVAESAYLPKISAAAVGGFLGASGGRSSLLGQTFNTSNSDSAVITAVSVQWLLFDFGERAAVVESAKQVSVMSNIAFTASHQQLIYAVSVAFYANAAAQARVHTAQASLQNAQAVQAAAEDRYQHGVGTVMEVAQARQATAQANLALVQATGGAEDAYLALVNAMGISPLTKLRVADVSGRKLSPAMQASVESILSASLARRPDVLSAYAAAKASRANVRAAKAEFMPKVFMSATGDYNSGLLDITALPAVGQGAGTGNITGSRWGGNVIAGVTMPLYDGGVRAATLAQARAEADSAEARLTRTREDAVREIVVADNALRTSLSAYSASEVLTAATQITFDSALAAYRNGVGSITDTTLAETQLLQAKNASSDAYSTALSAAATLALATGALGAAPE